MLPIISLMVDKPVIFVTWAYVYSIIINYVFSHMTEL